MRGTIVKIDFTRRGTDDQFYQSVYFRMSTGASAKTHLCRGFRNFSHWRGKLEVGLVLDNLQMKSEGIINADCHPVRIAAPKQLPLL